MPLASYVFLLVFLPATLVGYYVSVARLGPRAGQAWLCGASLGFCVYAGPASLIVLCLSSVMTFGISRALVRRHAAQAHTGAWLALGVCANVAALAYFKYAGFLTENLSALLGSDLRIAAGALPLGISFITFQQIAYLVEAARGATARDAWLDYAFFISFFPKLIAGPLADPMSLTDQLRAPGVGRYETSHLAVGLTLIGAGLFKKVMIADELGECADPVFAAAASGAAVPALAAWLGSSAYMLQIYFDFSGYSEMALGAARCFGLRLPLNFDSPYQATNIGDFWRRWHMTLNVFLTRYLYTPMATPIMRWCVRRNLGRATLFLLTIAIPTTATFTIAGLWHGPAWTFVIFGLLHGLYLSSREGWRQLRRAWFGKVAPLRGGGLGAWALTMLGVLISLIFFRAGSVSEALALLAAMCGLGAGAELPVGTELVERRDMLLIAIAAGIAFLAPNIVQLLRAQSPALQHTRGDPPIGTRWAWRPSSALALAAVAIWVVSLAALGEVSAFIYYRF